MRRIAVLFFAMFLVAAACGDDDAGEEQPATTAAPATTSAPATTTAPTTTTTAAPTTTTAPPTTTSAPTTTEAAVDPNLAIRVAGARLLAGEWSGQWVNTTFGSMGPIDVTISVDGDAGFMIANVDVGGSVFGMTDPDPRVFELDLVTGPPYQMRSSLFGEFTVDIGNDGSFTLVAPDVPVEGITTITIDGSLNTQVFAATYLIESEGGATAEGEIEVTKE